MNKRLVWLMIVAIILPLLVANAGCEPQIEYEQYADYAIEMTPPSITIEYMVNNAKFSLDVKNGDSVTIYPSDQVTFSYTLANTTDKNYRFKVCLFWMGYEKALGCDELNFIGKSSLSFRHDVTLSPGSGQLSVEGANIIVEPIGNDTRPVYFVSTLKVDAACSAGEKCCEYFPDGSCRTCIDESNNEVCP